MSHSLSFAQLAAQFQTVNLNTLLWRPKAKTNADGLAAIRLRITIDGRRIERSSGIQVAEADWDAKNGRIKGGGALARKQNEQLQLLKAHVLELVNLMKATGRTVTARTLALQLASPSLGKSPCFITLCQQQLELHYGNKPGSLALHSHALKRLIDWHGSSADGTPLQLPLDEFTPELATLFYGWLLTVRQLKVRTANASISSLTNLFKRAVEMELAQLENNPFRLLRRKKKAPTQRLRLTLEQFAMLRDADLSDKLGRRALVARDVYVAQYYLHGSRVGAIFKLRWQDIAADRVRLQVEKGGPLKSIRIAPELARVLARYRPSKPNSGDLVFPLLQSNFYALTLEKQHAARKSAVSFMSRGLSKIGAVLGLPDGLHSHTARHTLALHAATVGGVRVAQAMLGHASMQQTEEYVGEIPTEALRAAEQLLYGGTSSFLPEGGPEGGRVVPLWKEGQAA